MKRLLFLFTALGLMALTAVSPHFISGQTAPATPLLPTQVVTTAVSAAVTDTTATNTLAAAGTGLRWYITDVSCINVSASTQDSAIIKSGTTSLWQIACTPGSVGNVKHFEVPLRQPDANTAITFTGTASVTSVYFVAAGYKGR